MPSSDLPADGNGIDDDVRQWPQDRAMDEHRFAELLQAWSAGDNAAGDQLYAVAYEELKTIAHRSLASQGRGDQLQTTVLVNECYLKLIGAGRSGAHTRQHFLALCARAMRQIIVDSARRQLAGKRGGEGGSAVTLEQSRPRLRRRPRAALPPEAVAALDQALTSSTAASRAWRASPSAASSAAWNATRSPAVLGVTERTVQREWLRVKALLVLALEDAERRVSRPGCAPCAYPGYRSGKGPDQALVAR
jgi:RNA polymerase sigma factor (TIGR02999 family)